MSGQPLLTEMRCFNQSLPVQITLLFPWQSHNSVLSSQPVLWKNCHHLLFHGQDHNSSVSKNSTLCGNVLILGSSQHIQGWDAILRESHGIKAWNLPTFGLKQDTRILSQSIHASLYCLPSKIRSGIYNYHSRYSPKLLFEIIAKDSNMTREVKVCSNNPEKQSVIPWDSNSEGENHFL